MLAAECPGAGGHRQYAKDKRQRSSVSVAGAGVRRTAWRLAARVAAVHFVGEFHNQNRVFFHEGR